MNNQCEHGHLARVCPICERDAEIKDLRKACQHYESALNAAWPEGAKGESWEQWNEARKLWEYWK